MNHTKAQSNAGLSVMMPDAIRHLELLGQLSADQQKQIINVSQVIPFGPGETIFSQGDMDDYVYYLLDGELQLICDGQLLKTVIGGTEEARHRLGQLRPRQVTALAVTDVILFRSSRSLLDSLLENGTTTAASELEVHELDETADGDWMSTLLNSPLFARIPASNIQMIFSRMAEQRFTAGEVIIRQGDVGDYYYIIKSGRCRVTRKTQTGRNEVVLAELQPGDSFGEQALIANDIRSATVTMQTNGQLMRLDRSDFTDLLLRPILRGVSLAESEDAISSGATWIDVRSKDQHERHAKEGALHLPLPLVRAQHRRLEFDKPYICYCDDGSVSAVAAFILAKLGYDVAFLQEESARPGLAEDDYPEAERRDENTLTAVESASPPVSQTTTTSEEQEPAEGQRVALERITHREKKMQAQEQRINESLNDALQMKQELEVARSNIAKEMEEKLLIEREKIEQQNNQAMQMLAEARQIKQEIEKTREAASHHADAAQQRVEQRISEIESQAEIRIEQERERLKQIAVRNAQELAEIKRMKQLAEEKLAKERQSVLKNAEENRQQINEFQRMKTLLEDSQKRLQEEAEQRQLARIRKEEAMQKKMRAEVLEERKRLEEELTANRRLLDQARDEKRAAEAERVAANRDVERVIEEYKKEHQRTVREQEQRLQLQRQELEQEAARIKEMLSVSQQASSEAKQAVLRAEQDLKRLNATRRLLEKQSAVETVKQQVGEEIEAAEGRVIEASSNLNRAEKAHEEAETAQLQNREQLSEQQAAEVEMRKQLETDVEEWLAEQNQISSTEEYQVLEQQQADVMRDILARSEQHKQKIKDHNQSLIEELSQHFSTDE